MKRVLFYIDFVSPYTWLALKRAGRFGEENAVRWEPHPVVFAAILGHHGLVGPVETEAKRNYSFQDISRLAHARDLKLEGPPRHPFRSLDALRTQVLFNNEPQALALAVRMADACWSEGRDLEEPDVLCDVVAGVGLDPTDLKQRIATSEIKQRLRESTDQAIANGVFGVPTFLSGTDLFWGHDRMDQLAAYLSGVPDSVAHRAETMLARPWGVDRRKKNDA